MCRDSGAVERTERTEVEVRRMLVAPLFRRPAGTHRKPPRPVPPACRCGKPFAVRCGPIEFLCLFGEWGKDAPPGFEPVLTVAEAVAMLVCRCDKAKREGRTPSSTVGFSRRLAAGPLVRRCRY